MGLLLIIGGVIGFSVGALLGALSLSAASFPLGVLGIIGTLLGPLISLLAPFLGALSLPTAIALWGLSVLVVTGIAYALAAIDLPPFTPAPGFLEITMRGFIIGVTTSVNFLVWLIFLGSPIIATVLAIINFLAVVPGVSGSRFIYQPVLGFASWLLPMTYLIQPFGILLFIINLPSAVRTPFGFAALRFNSLTATIETTGGAVVTFLVALSPSPGTGGFCLGNFVFLTLAPPGTPPFPPLGPQSSFTGPGLSAHESGHTLQVAALGGFHGWLNAFDENIPPPGRGAFAYGEQIADSHFGGLGGPSVPVW